MSQSSTTKRRLRVLLLIAVALVSGCRDDASLPGATLDVTTGAEVDAAQSEGSGDADLADGCCAKPDGGSTSDALIRGGDTADARDVVDPGVGWPRANEWSWNGRWVPGAEAFPMTCLLDDEYGDGHLYEGEVTPLLPPGDWDWNDADDDFANYRNFRDNLGHFERLVDSLDRHFGWRLIPNDPDAAEYDGPADYFRGSCGPNVLDLGAAGSIHSFGRGNLADGPDVLRFTSSYSLDFRTGSSDSGATHDDDLVVAGGAPNLDGAFDVVTTTVHTGPGADWVFVRDLSRAAIDLGNGAHGRTDTLDPDDGDDLVVLRGNTHDFRVMGGRGADVAVWYVDDNIQTELWLGPNFFGGGADGAALWDDPGTDRLVLVIPTDTPLIDAPATPPGALLVWGTSGQMIIDEPVAHDPFARYCIECGVGPEGQKTMILEYHKADESVFTGYFFVTAFEELQVGLGADATVYALDDVNGTAVLMPDAEVFEPPAWPEPSEIWGAFLP